MGIRFGQDIIVNIWEIKVVENIDLLFMIGADILCRGSRGRIPALIAYRCWGLVMERWSSLWGL